MFQRIHFQPRYSPIVAHIEFIKIMITGNPESERLNPLKLTDVRESIKYAAKPDFLIWGYLKKFQNEPGKRLIIFAFAAVCAAAFMFSMFSLLRISKAKE